MKNINEKILNALQEDQSTYTVPEADATAIGLIRASFTGTFRFTMIFMVIFQLIFGGLAFYCAYQLFGTDVTNLKIEWLTGAIAAFIIFSIARLWFFMELNRLSLLREMKRLEMQVAFLSEKVSGA